MSHGNKRTRRPRLTLSGFKRFFINPNRVPRLTGIANAAHTTWSQKGWTALASFFGTLSQFGGHGSARN